MIFKVIDKLNSYNYRVVDRGLELLIYKNLIFSLS
jgi:hypothetical protein